MVVCVELITDDELARSFRTFTPEPRERNVAASVSVVGGALVIETVDPELNRFLRDALATAADERGHLVTYGHHTSERVRGGVRLNEHYPGDRVAIDDPRYLEGVARALCFYGEHEPDKRYRGRVLHAFVDYAATPET